MSYEFSLPKSSDVYISELMGHKCYCGELKEDSDVFCKKHYKLLPKLLKSRLLQSRIFVVDALESYIGAYSTARNWLEDDKNSPNKKLSGPQ